MIRTVTVYSCGTPEHALGHLRICAPLRHAGVQVCWHRFGEPFAPEQVAASDIVIVQRDFPRDLNGYARLMQAADLYRKPIVLEIDDLLWELPSNHPDQLTHAYTDALWPMLLAAMQADAITVVSPSLAKYLQGIHSQVEVLPNYFDDGLWHFRPPRSRDDAAVRIGYMGGGSHIPDVQAIVPALTEVLRRYPRTQLIFWGLPPPAGLEGHPQVVWHPLDTQHYPQFAAYFLQQEFDIFIAPLQDNLFNACKSAVKFFECSAVGAAGVCSDVAPYRQVITHGETGFLAKDTETWIECLGKLIEQPALRLAMAASAQDAIRQHWLLSAHAHQWVERYQQVVASYQPRERAASLTLAAKVQEQQGQRLHQLEAAWQARLADSERHGAALQAKLDEIERSRAWRWVQRFWRWRARLKPKL